MLGRHCYGRLSTLHRKGIVERCELRETQVTVEIGDFNMAVGPRPRDLVKTRSTFMGRLSEGSSFPRTRDTVPWVAVSGSKDQNGGAYR